MSKVAHYLQEHLTGEVMTSQDARRYFATDGSIFSVVPSLVVYPRNEQDVRKAARFTWQLAERGRVIPLTARGAGTDQAGAALGSGIILSFPAHMNRIVEFDSKTGVVVAEPGTNYAKLQQTLHTHARFLPPFPSSFEYSTIGGAVANNASGEKTVKYGDTSNYVRSLRVVLANGEVIETSRLSKKELGKKLGLSTFEGEVYRAVDALIEEHHSTIDGVKLKVTKNSAGYNLLDIKRKDGSFDLTPLIVGSQGTLGIVTEITFETEVYNPQTTLLMAEFEDINKAQLAVTELRQQSDLPCAIEMVDKNLLELVDQINPNLLKSLVQKPFPGVILLVEFDNGNDRLQTKLAKKAGKIFDRHAIRWQSETDRLKQEELWKIRHSSAIVVAQSEGNKKALPVIEDGIVPVERFHDYIQNVYALFQKAGLQVAVWGHAGDANVHLQPYFDLSQVGDRQKIFKLMDDYYRMVISLGGTTSGEHNDGRLRAPYLPEVFGPDVYALFQKIKLIFDPYGTMNPGVKMNVKLDDIKPLMRSSYSLDHLYNHMPRS
jgi:FAD/FMN-containing dehydrogenase